MGMSLTGGHGRARHGFVIGERSCAMRTGAHLDATSRPLRDIGNVREPQTVRSGLASCRTRSTSGRPGRSATRSGPPCRPLRRGQGTPADRAGDGRPGGRAWGPARDTGTPLLFWLFVPVPVPTSMSVIANKSVERQTSRAVRRVLCPGGPHDPPGDGHPSRTGVATGLVRSTRGLGRAALERPRRARFLRRRSF